MALELGDCVGREFVLGAQVHREARQLTVCELGQHCRVEAKDSSEPAHDVGARTPLTVLEPQDVGRSEADFFSELPHAHPDGLTASTDCCSETLLSCHRFLPSVCYFLLQLSHALPI